MKFLLQLQSLMLLVLAFTSMGQAMHSTRVKNLFFRELVHEAIRSNSTHNLLQHFDVNYQDENGMTALHEAMDYYNVYVAEQLIDAGADVNIKDISGGTVFARTVSLNDAALVKKMIDAGADVNLKSGEYEWTPLHTAAYSYSPNNTEQQKKQKIAIINYLFKAGADVNEVNHDGNTALHLAIREGNIVALRVLLQHPEINIWIKNKKGDTALDSAKRVKEHLNFQLGQQIFRD